MKIHENTSKSTGGYTNAVEVDDEDDARAIGRFEIEGDTERKKDKRRETKERKTQKKSEISRRKRMLEREDQQIG